MCLAPHIASLTVPVKVLPAAKAAGMYKATQPCSKDAIGGTKLQGGQEKSGGALARTSARMPGFKVGGRARANSKTRGAASAGAVQQQTSAISCNRFFT